MYDQRRGTPDMAQDKYPGKCRLCGKTFSGSVMSRHLQSCLGKSPLPAANGKTATQKLYHIQVKGGYDGEYWLHLLVPISMRLVRLDDFLRDIWLECCGHMSSFKVGLMRYSPAADSGGWTDDEPADVPIGSILNVRDSFTYVYDFGTTTELALRVVGEVVAEAPKNKILVLARNAARQYTCRACGKPAKRICMTCGYELEDPFYCGLCAESHQCDERMTLPITNSPRNGMCAYGGEADDDEDAYRV
jgi:hypothetical protein